jgi:hypothetical protein
MNLWNKIDQSSVRTRMIILVLVTSLLMAGVVYIWYRSFQATLIGSFQVENKQTAQESQATSSSLHTPSFLGSLSNLFSDIAIGWDWSRFQKLMATARSFFNFNNINFSDRVMFYEK